MFRVNLENRKTGANIERAIVARVISLSAQLRRAILTQVMARTNISIHIRLGKSTESLHMTPGAQSQRMSRQWNTRSPKSSYTYTRHSFLGLPRFFGDGVTASLDVVDPFSIADWPDLDPA